MTAGSREGGEDVRAAGEIGFLGDVGCGERLRGRMTHDVDGRGADAKGCREISDRHDSLANDLHVGRYKRWIRRGNEMGLELGYIFPAIRGGNPTVAGFKRWIACA